jgi:hypothetical protein
MTEPPQRPGRSKQDFGTPQSFLDAAARRFGPLAWDLAAHSENKKCPCYFGPGSPHHEDSLDPGCSWEMPGTLWLNPEFADIAPWAKKCSEHRARTDWTLMLVPASVGSEWFKDHVQHKSVVLGLSPRMSFDGKNPYPKDLMLCCFGFGLSGFDTWRWDRP